MRTKTIGTATDLGYSGADAQLSYFGKSPKYYITKNRARKLGWVDRKGNLHDVLPDMMIGGASTKTEQVSFRVHRTDYGMKLISTMKKVIATVKGSYIQTMVLYLLHMTIIKLFMK